MVVAEQIAEQGSVDDTARYQTMPMAQLRELARHQEHAEAAGRVFVDRVIEIEAETRLWHRHANEGFQPFSPTATLGEQPGGGTAAAEPLAIHYERNHEMSAERQAVQWFVQQAMLHPRQLLALLIRGAKSYPRRRGDFAKSYDEIARDLPRYAQMLGFGPVAVMDDVRRGAGRKPVFANGKALQNAAAQGRVEMLLLAQV